MSSLDSESPPSSCSCSFDQLPRRGTPRAIPARMPLLGGLKANYVQWLATDGILGSSHHGASGNCQLPIAEDAEDSENGNCGTARRRTAENCNCENCRGAHLGGRLPRSVGDHRGGRSGEAWGNCSSHRLLLARARAEVKSSSQRPTRLSATLISDRSRDARIREPFSASLVCRSRQFSFLQFRSCSSRQSSFLQFPQLPFSELLLPALPAEPWARASDPASGELTRTPGSGSQRLYRAFPRRNLRRGRGAPVPRAVLRVSLCSPPRPPREAPFAVHPATSGDSRARSRFKT